jgi:hypothetical protein
MGQNSSPTHDVFVSYSSQDKNWADAACAVLEHHRVRCWIAPRDITPGDEWGAAIVKGIHDSRIMVLIFSGHANDSGQVRREVERAISQGMNVLPVRIEDVRPEGAMEYALGNMHWLDAFTPPVKQQMEVLARSVQTLLGREVEPAPAPAAAKPAAVAPVRSPEGARVIDDQPAKTRANRRTEPRSDRLVESEETEDAMAAAPNLARTQWPRWVWSAVALGVLMLGLFAAWMGGVFKVKTPDGVIVLENVPKDSEILVDGNNITFTLPGGGKPVKIRAVPGQHKVEVKKDGFQTFGEVVTVKTDESEEVTVRLEPLVVDRPPVPPASPNRIPPSGPARLATRVSGGLWTVEGDQLIKEGLGHGEVIFGDQGWSDYDLTFEGRKSTGSTGILARFRICEAGNYLFELADDGTTHKLHIASGSGWRQIWGIPGTVGTLEWYKVKITLRKEDIRIELDNHLLCACKDGSFQRGNVLLGFWNGAGRFRNIKVTAPDGTVLWEGPPELPEK